MPLVFSVFGVDSDFHSHPDSLQVLHERGEFDIVPSFQSGNQRLGKYRYIRLFEVHPPAQFSEMNWEYILVREQLGTIARSLSG